jgi:hypothetical protein
VPQELDSIKTYGYGRHSNDETKNLYTVRLFELKIEDPLRIEFDESQKSIKPKVKLAWLKETLKIYESVKTSKQAEDSVYNVEDKLELESPFETSLIKFFRTKSRYIKFLKKKFLYDKFIKSMHFNKEHIKLL